VRVLFFILVILILILFYFYFYFHFLEKKNLYCCGDNIYFQKGIFTDDSKLKVPTKIEFFKDIEIESVFPGSNSTFFKTKG
jgi:alpha-tubulin suppressor-like RCC1 family protein